MMNTPIQEKTAIPDGLKAPRPSARRGGWLRQVARYLVPVAIVAAAVVVRLVFLQSLGMRAAFLTFYPAIMLAALYGGTGPGLLATMLSGCLASLFWIEPAGSLEINNPGDWLGMAIFLLSGTMISFITGAMQRAQARTRQGEARAATTANAMAEEFRLLAEAMPQIVWITRADGWNIYFNQQWVDYTGLTLEESYGHGWNKPFHPDDQPRAWDAWQNAVTNRATYALECQLRRADGTYRWWLVRGVPVLDANGEVLKWFGTCTDIHDFKLAEEALREREREERFQTMANAMPQLAWIAQPDGHIFWYNQRWYDYTGTTPEQMEGWGWQSVHDPIELPKVLERWKASIATGASFEMTFPLRGADGIFRPFLTRGHPLKDAEGRVLQWFGTNTDVTDQKRVEEVLRENERRERERAGELAAILEAVPIPVFIVNDPDCLHITGNRLADDILRIPHGNELSLSAFSETRPVHFRTIKDGRELRLDELPAQQAARGVHVQDFEFILAFDDGMVRHVLGYGTPLLDEQGRPRGAVASLVDITDLKRIEEENRQLAHIVQAANDAIIGKSLEGKITSWNSGATKLYGYTAEEMVGRSIAILAPSEDDVEERAILEKVGRGEAVEHYETVRRRKDGQEIDVSLTVSPVTDAHGRIVGASAISHDITERKMKEAELRKLRSAVDQSPATVVITGPTGIIEYANPKFSETTGYTLAEALGQNPRILKSGAHSPDFYKALWETIVSGAVWNGEICNRKKNGELYWESAAIGPVFDDAGRIVNYVAVKEDITERKRIEEENRKLTEEMRIKAADLEVSNKELEAFAYSVSHDLRSPLRTIDAFSQAVSEDYGDRLDDEGKDQLRRIRKAAQRMGQLIDDLLNLSRVTRLGMNRREVDLSGLARIIVADLQATDRNRKVEFFITEGARANGDLPLLRVVLENLLGNAWKYTGKTPHAIIEFGTNEQEGHPVYFVRDNGAGFDMAFANNLFGVFQRLHKETEFPGTGIGLATVQRIVHRHAGRVWAQSEPGKGATFFFTL